MNSGALKAYDKKLGEELTNIGVVSLMIPLGVKVEEKYMYEPEKTLIISKGDSKLYLGETNIFSTSGALYCIDCQDIGSFKTTIMGQKRNLCLIQRRNHETGKIEYITKSHLPIKCQAQSCIYDLSIVAMSLDDFLLFLQIAETIEFDSLESKPPENPLAWKVYQNEKYSFKLKYPPDFSFTSHGPNISQEKLEAGEMISGTVPPSFESVTFLGPENEKFKLEIYHPLKDPLNEDYVIGGDCGSQFAESTHVNRVLKTKHGITVLERRQSERNQEKFEERIDYCFVSGTGNLISLRSSGLPYEAAKVHEVDQLLRQIISTIRIN